MSDGGTGKKPSSLQGGRKQVALLLPPALTESFEITLGRAVDLAADPNVNLTLLTCNGAVRGCAVSAVSNMSLCRHCCHVRDQALKEHLPDTMMVSLDPYVASSREIETGTAVEEELQNGVTSTLKTFYRVDVGPENASFFRRAVFRFVERQWLRYSRSIFVGLRSYLAQHRPERLEFFNGPHRPHARRGARCQGSEDRLWRHRSLRRKEAALHDVQQADPRPGVREAGASRLLRERQSQ
jgi:hypothetical protein